MDQLSVNGDANMDFIDDDRVKPQMALVFVEILRRNASKSLTDEEELNIQHMVYEYLKGQNMDRKQVKCTVDDGPVGELVEEITVNHPVLFNDAKFEDIQFFVYSVNDNGAEVETINTGGGDLDDVPASHHWLLPNREFQGSWEFLYYEEDLKENLLQFSKTIMLFAHNKVDMNAISCNKLVLLHGPPGTGKTSLCKALAQKISIHMKDIFQYTHLFEINSHSLFSKWFSESGKLVLKLFATIKDVADDPNSLVIILIDEVESIAYSRDSVSAQEPSDSLRVVNAVLTQLDQLRAHSNVLVLTTSNLSGSIDLAFIDRADLKQYVGLPAPIAIYHIFKSAIDELIKVEIVIDANSTENLGWYAKDVVTLLDIAKKAHGLSGRSLRKLPLLAHAWFVKCHQIDLATFLEALDDAVDKHLADTIKLAKNAESKI